MASIVRGLDHLTPERRARLGRTAPRVLAQEAAHQNARRAAGVVTRRVVRATPDFFATLDHQFGEQRGPNGEPSAVDSRTLTAPKATPPAGWSLVVTVATCLSSIRTVIAEPARATFSFMVAMTARQPCTSTSTPLRSMAVCTCAGTMAVAPQVVGGTLMCLHVG